MAEPPAGDRPGDDPDGEAPVWRVRVPATKRGESGMYADGYTIPDAFPTPAAARSFIDRCKSLGPRAHVVRYRSTRAHRDSLDCD